ncbi:acyl carrier protein [Streptomyces flavofungini]|uniref:acyl carrier protein n=1 Tax=Streptomyces flavofungini TaxID=68200 RepID=UPI0025B22D2D|nr:acyl carrier protein [Streptomyces flavofungini]WJV45632.1 acyl carrier protein [Streptomyces flavofungini]
MSDVRDAAGSTRRAPFEPSGPAAAQSALADIWRDLLGPASFTAGDDFFHVGGTSVTAIRFLQRVEKRFGPDTLTPEQLYDDPRLGALAAAVWDAVRANS